MQNLLRALAPLALAMFVITAHAAGQSDRVIPASPRIQIGLPFSGEVESLLMTVSAVARVKLGVETEPALPPAAQQPHVAPQRPHYDSKHVYNRRPVSDVLNDLVAIVPTYLWRERGGVLEIGPVRRMTDGPNSPLNQVVPSFDVENGSAAEALTAVRRLFEPGYAGSKGFIASGPPLGAAGIEQGERLFSVHLKNATVREVLDAVVSAHGELAWFARYQGPEARADTLILRLQSFDGWGRMTVFSGALRGREK